MPRLDVSKTVPIHTVSRPCAFCNASYVPGRSNQRFCSKPCVVDYCHAQSRADPTRKDCLSCRERKPYTEYERGHKLCLKCEAERAGNVKTCRLCKILKPLDEYYRRKSGPYEPTCKKCASKRSADRYARPEIRGRQRDIHLLYRFGITQVQWEAKLEAQGGVCAICSRAPEGKSFKSFSVDHDHRCCPGEKTCGKCVRDILCTNCNSALGLIADSIETAEQLITYLRRHQ